MGRVVCAAEPSDTEQTAAESLENAIRALQVAAVAAVTAVAGAGSVTALLEAVDWFTTREKIEDRVVDLLEPAYRSAWVAVSADDLVELPVDLTIRSRVYAATRAGELAKVLVDRDTVRAVIVDALGRGLPVPATARAVVGSIGLDARSARALARYAGSGAAHRDVERYARRLLRTRATVIARTELAYAANAGRQEAWREARRRGALGPNATKRWVTAHDERVCPECGPMDGQTVGLDDEFSHGAQMPPRHPRCRCTATIATAE